MNKDRYKHIVLLIGFFIFMILTSCKVKLKTSINNTKELKISNLIKNVESNYYDYTTLSVKFQAKFEDEDNKQNIQGVYRINNDSIIWISMGPTLGMEIVRAVIFQDSLKFINRYDKTFYEGTYKYLEKILKVEFDYKSIENLLANRLLFSNNNFENWQSYVSKNYSYDIDSNRYCLRKEIWPDSLHTNNSFLSNLVEIRIIPGIYKIESLSWVDEKNSREINISYSDFKREKDKYYPDNLLIDIKSLTDTLSIDIKIKQLSIDKKLRYPFKIPNKKYIPIE